MAPPASDPLVNVLAQLLGERLQRDDLSAKAEGFPRYLVNVASVDINLDGVQQAWEEALGALLARWADEITPSQQDEIIYQVREAIASHDVTALQSLHVSTSAAAQLLEVAMSGMAESGAKSMAKDQGIGVNAGTADGHLITSVAALVAVLLAQGLANAASREALRHWTSGSGANADEVAAGVREHLESLSDAFLRDNLGGALSRAQSMGRTATLRQAPEASMYSSEILDKRICDPCRKVDGKFLGLSSDMSQVDRLYPNGQYIDCLGGIRCRGQVVAVWRPEQVGG